MKKTIGLVAALLVLGAVAAKVTQTVRGRAAYRACRYYIVLDDGGAHYPTSYYRPECLHHPSELRWRETDMPKDFYSHPYAVEPRTGGEPSWNIVAVGDIMAPADLQIGAYVHRNDPGEACGGYDWVLAGVGGLVSSADLAMGNLETPVAPSIPRAGLWRFNVDPMYLDAMKNIGFDVLMTANNHTLDYGVKGIRETQQELDKRDLVNCGTSPPGHERQKFVMAEVGDTSVVRIALLNYTFEMNPIRLFRSYRYLNYLVRGRCINWFDVTRPRGIWERTLRFGRNALFSGALYIDEDAFLQTMAENIGLARGQGAEYVIVFLQWGEAYRVMPARWQREIALRMCLRGADAIIGAGPHVIQPMERVYTWNGSVVDSPQEGAHEHFIAYSLGNLVSHHGGVARYGMLLDMRLARDADGVYVQRVETHIVKNASEETQVDLAGGGTAPVNTYRTQVVDMTEFLEAVQR